MVPDAGARGNVGSGWWVVVSVYCELSGLIYFVLRTAHLYHTWTGIIGLAACGKPGCPSRVPRFHHRQSLDHAGSRPSLYSKLYAVTR